MPRLLVRALITLTVALCLGAITGVQQMIAMPHENRWTLDHALIMATPHWVFWALALPLIVIIAKRLPIERATLATTLPTHLLIGLVFSLAIFTIWRVFMGLIGHAMWTEPGHTWGAHFFSSLRESWPAHIGTYFLLLAGIQSFGYYRLYRQRELLTSQLATQLSQARLQALRMQLNPHFLFNAMNSIAMLVRRNENTHAVTMLAGLSDLLRYVLEDSAADEVPLREELVFLKRYLDIEKVRFQDRLTVKLDISDDALDAFVPNLLLQPLVENAIGHGIARKVSPGTIEIIARRLGDRLLIQITDDGPGLGGPSLAGSGVGLSNTRSRLEQLYGAETGFELRNGSTAGAVATVTLPFNTRPRMASSAA